MNSNNRGRRKKEERKAKKKEKEKTMNGGQNSAPLFVLQPELLSQLSQLQKIKKKNLFSFLLRKRKIKKDEWKFFKFSTKKNDVINYKIFS